MTVRSAMPQIALMESLSKTLRTTPTTALPQLDHAMKHGHLTAERATRMLETMTTTAEVFSTGIDAKSMGELLEMRRAIEQRCLNLQKSWFDSWRQWALYSAGVTNANTLSKLSEREINISLQAGQIVQQQVTGVLTLLENIEIEYAYWLQNKLEEKKHKNAMNLKKSPQ